MGPLVDVADTEHDMRRPEPSPSAPDPPRCWRRLERLCADPASVADWCTTVLGWRERGRWSDDDGVVTNVELDPGGGGEVWLDGPVPDWYARTGGLGIWVGILVDDVDAVRDRLVAGGHPVPDPTTRPFGVRELSISDPEGHRWGFVQRRSGAGGVGSSGDASA